MKQEIVPQGACLLLFCVVRFSSPLKSCRHLIMYALVNAAGFRFVQMLERLSHPGKKYLVGVQFCRLSFRRLIALLISDTLNHSCRCMMASRLDIPDPQWFHASVAPSRGNVPLWFRQDADLRFYDIDEGEILMDGHDLREYTLASLRNQVALVSQNVHLFNDTVANNIAYARTEQYSREQIEEAARMAYAMDFINKMDNGLDTVIGENGVLLSGGQRQRIAIARALLRDSPILILDEATSALDTESERAIQAALDELQKNRTSLVIAHRLSTIEKADEIVVVEDGVIVERGTHNDLLEHRGVYAQLHKMQFGQ